VVELRGKGNHNTNSIGDISEAAITTRFLQLGYVVLIPYGGNQRYDLIIEDTNKTFWRIQCKSGRLHKNKESLVFNTSIRNVTGKNRQPRNYRGQCDYFAVYNAELQKVYLIPVDDVGITTARLWIVPVKKNERNILWAKDYEL
jgi:hypothetical protein